MGFLRGSAASLVESELLDDKTPSWMGNWEEFEKFLKLRFGDPDEKGTARRMLESLRQTTSASEYFGKFRMYTNILGYKDETMLVDLAIKGLFPALRDHLNVQGRDHMGCVSDLMAFAIPLDNVLSQNAADARRRGGEDGRKGGWTPGGQGGKGEGTGSAWKSGPVRSREEIERMKTVGECFGCGQKGHLRRNCPVEAGKGPVSNQVPSGRQGGPGEGPATGTFGQAAQVKTEGQGVG